MTVANLTKDRAPRHGDDYNPLGIRGVDHIEFLRRRRRRLGEISRKRARHVSPRHMAIRARG